MTHALATHHRVCHFHATLVTDDALVADLFVLAAVTLPVLGRSKNFLGKEALLFRLLSSVVNRLRLGYLTKGPRTNRVGGGQAQADRVEVGRFERLLLFEHRLLF